MQQKAINFKSDFSAILSFEGGWATPFRLKFWTNSPSRSFTASYDGTKYTNCKVLDDGRLEIAFDSHNMGMGVLMLEPEFYLTNEAYADGICNENIAAFAPVFTDTDGNEYNVILDMTGSSTLETIGTLPAYYQKGDKGEPGKDGSVVEVTPITTSGTHIADITVDGETKELYAPNGGGGGGTSDYNDLDNKPQIAGVTLTGNNTLHDLGIQQEGEYAAKTHTHEIADVNGLQSALAGAGKVKTATINGTQHTPDDNGDINLGAGYVQDASYVHTDNNYNAAAVAEVAKVEDLVESVDELKENSATVSDVENLEGKIDSINETLYQKLEVSTFSTESTPRKDPITLKTSTTPNTSLPILVPAGKTITVHCKHNASGIYLASETIKEGDVLRNLVWSDRADDISYTNNTDADVYVVHTSYASFAAEAYYVTDTPVIQKLSEISQRQDKDDASWGHYTDRDSITLTAKEDGYAVDKTGTKVAKEGWAIAEFQAIKGNTYLFKPGTMDGNTCIFAEKVEKQESRNIDYKYTYDSEGRPATASATYNETTHNYTYSYDDEGTETITDVTDPDNPVVVERLPLTYTATVGSYSPMTILNADAELPGDGYCRFVSHFQSDTALTIAVSYNKADADLTMKVLRDGNTASICTQLSNIAKRVSSLSETVETAILGLDELLTEI